MSPDNVMEWTGDADDAARFAPFLGRADRVGARTIWWLEPDFTGRCDLLVTHELASDPPLRVRPGVSLELRGDWFVLRLPMVRPR